MAYLILGNGYIGNYLLNNLPMAVMNKSRINSQEDAEWAILGSGPDDIIINCIGKTGRPNVDWCEDHRTETAQANIMVPYWIAAACQKKNKYFVHIGSGCIYQGYEREWSEMDVPNFYGSFYSITKIVSQNFLAGYRNALILRIRMPIDEAMQERCYISKLIRYVHEGKSLFNALNTMTYLKDFVSVLRALTEIRATGTFNVVNPGPLTAEEILALYDPNIKPRIEPVKTVESRLKAGRTNCALSVDKLELMGLRIPELYNRIIDMRRAKG